MTFDPVTAVDFHTRLRTETAAAHQNLENLSASRAITAPDITRAAYTHYLNLMADVVHDTESQIHPILGSVIPDIEARKKGGWLQQDFEVLGYHKRHYKSVFNRSAPFSVPFALGILYVVEGSTLGGRFILKNVQAALGFDAENGGSYFAGYGNQSGRFWKVFLDRLTIYESETGSADDIIAGACFAFQSIYEHLSTAPAHED